MARCRCTNESCPCRLVAGQGVHITGEGSGTSPWVIAVATASQNIRFNDSGDIDFTVAGTGTATDPLSVTAVSRCISCLGGAPGDVLTKQPDGSYLPMPGTTAPAGTVHGDNVTVFGDGTIATPFRTNACTYADLMALCTAP